MLKRSNIYLTLLLFFFCSYRIDAQTTSTFFKVDRNQLNNMLVPNQIINVNDKSIDFFDYYSKPVESLFDAIGLPDYQYGWLGYSEYLFCAKIFGGAYYMEEIPIKSYVWRLDDKYLMCLCTYENEEDLLSFPISYRWEDILSSRFDEWLTKCSNEEGFNVLFWTILDSIDRQSLDDYYFEAYPELCPMNERSVCSLQDYYMSNFALYNITLSDAIGLTPDKYSAKIKEKPISSTIYFKENMPKWLQEETHVIKDKLPSVFRVEEYSKKIRPNNHVFYTLSNSLFFISKDRSDKIQIEL